MNLTYLEDIPTETPKFDFDLVAKALSSLLLQPSKNAVVLGIHGAWGSGKTTLMQSLRHELESDLPQDQRVFIDFNAWKFQDRQALWRALILHMLAELHEHGGDKAKIEELEQSLYRAFAVEEKGPWTINWRAVIVEIIGILLSILKLDFVANSIKNSTGLLGRLFIKSKNRDDKNIKENEGFIIDSERVDRLSSMLERTSVERHVLQVQSIEQFLNQFRKLINQLTQDGRQVFVFIDDLDRCLPDSALEIFESIKLFLDAPGCRYVVALDRGVIQKGLAVKYAQSGDIAMDQIFIDPDEYIEKTISVSYDLPRLSSADVIQLIEEFQLPITLDEKHKNLIIAGLGSNPRRVKRFMNTLAIQLRLAEVAKEAGLSVHEWLVTNSQPRFFDFFLKLLLIAYRHSGVFTIVLEDPELLERLQRVSNSFEQLRKDDGPDTARKKRKDALSGELPIVQALQSDEEFWRLMAEKPSMLGDPSIIPQLRSWFRHRPTD